MYEMNFVMKNKHELLNGFTNSGIGFNLFLTLLWYRLKPRSNIYSHAVSNIFLNIFN